MIYVLALSGKGDSKADHVALMTFDNNENAVSYIRETERLQSEGHKYWMEFNIVLPGEAIETYPN